MSMWKCAGCQGANPEGMRFCGHCGAPAVPAETDPAPVEAKAEPASGALRSFVSKQVADRLLEGQLTEDNRLVTALFADLSGFTPLADRLDPEALLEVMDPILRRLTDVVGRYDGYVDKFAGDALLVLFGAPVAHDDDAERALLVALDMHAELTAICAERADDLALTLHIGVNSGRGIARVMGSETRLDYAVLGDAVILAQRLESAAPAGETYVGETTVELARRHFAFESVGELTLKGKAKPVPAWRLVGRARLPAEASRSGLVGRERELATLVEALAALREGAGALVTVTGEPGVGKSRLLDELRSRAAAEGVTWLPTSCLSYGAALPYWPYAELVRRLIGVAKEDPPEIATERLTHALDALEAPDLRPYFAQLIGLPAPELAERDPEAARRELHAAIATGVGRLAANGPLILAVEDVHWLDSASRTLTAELAEGCADGGFLLLLTGRPEATPALAELLAGARYDVAVAPLAATAVESLLTEILGSAPPERLTDLIAERTGGNPYFVGEVVRALRDSGSLHRDGDAWAMSADWDVGSLPPTVEGVLSARIDALPADAVRVLQAAAVIGRRVAIPLLEGLLDRADAAALTELRARGFFDDAGDEREPVVVFHHALAQEVAYGRLLRRQRRDLHRRLADVAEELYGSGDDVIDVLARHLYLGEAGAKAGDYLLRAADRAERLFANAEAIEHLRQAAEVFGAHGRLGEVLVRWAGLLELGGQYDEALPLYEQARDAGAGVRAWAGLAATLRKQGKYLHALKVVDEAFADERLAAADVSPLWLERGWTFSVSGRFPEAIEAAQTGLEQAEPNGSVAGYLLLQLARAEAVCASHAAALDHATAAETIFRETADLRGGVTAARILGQVLNELARNAEAAEALGSGLALAERLGAVEEIGGCLVNLGLVKLALGEVEVAIDCDRRAIESFERIGHGAGSAIAHANLAEKLLHQGDFNAAIAAADRATEVALEIGHEMTVADAMQTKAEVLLRRGEPVAAAECAERAAGRYGGMNALRYAAEAWQLAARAWQAAGNTEQARAATARACLVEEPTKGN
ncbi:MAG TPA: adenylate/guanylate cyclase domain-containing protein [Mycobacteriales bacterium]|nr:adenylate/guanylate cyclase domain-containing protein [Mycobacteriales bacterium]